MHQFIIPWTKLVDHENLGGDAMVQGEVRVTAVHHVAAFARFRELHPDRHPVTYWAGVDYTSPFVSLEKSYV